MSARKQISTRIIERFVLTRVRPHAIAVLTERLSGVIAHPIFWWSAADFERIAERSVHHHAFGTRLILSFASMSAALYRTLIACGAEADEATYLVAEIGRRTYKRLWRIPWRLARLLAFNRARRLAATVRLFRVFPFGDDDYEMHQLSFPDGRVNLCVRRCPTIALYEELGIPHLCRALVCDLDFALASQWHATLERRQTLADGDYECDFRWKPLEEGAA